MTTRWSPSRQKLKDAVKVAVPLINRFSERAGVRLQPVHYYSEVPERGRLAEHKAGWARPVLPAGQEWDLDAQLAWLVSVTAEHVHEVVGLEEWRSLGVENGPGFGPIESQILHAVLRSQRPRRLVEVGSGVSTALAHRAVARNVAEGWPGTEITCVEPYPRDRLRRLEGVTVIEQGALDVPHGVFDQLGAGDVLFIDSTHAVKTGSELFRLYLEVIPALPPGVLIHVHDIYLPYLYGPDVLSSLFDWQETTLVAALLTDNRRLEVRACTSALHHAREAELKQLFPDFRPRRMRDGMDLEKARGDVGMFPSSLWMATV